MESTESKIYSVHDPFSCSTGSIVRSHIKLGINVFLARMFTALIHNWQRGNENYACSLFLGE